MTIRLGLPEEHDSVRALVRAAYAHYVSRLGREPIPMSDDYHAHIAAGEVWVLLGQSDAIVGVLVLIDEPDALLLDNVAVAETEQGKGHGRALIRFAEQEAIRRGRRTLRLFTNVKMTENIALYHRLGFAEVRRADEHGFARVFMEKTLPAT
jgi:ribosomal protein S18 acetylase RimI-like enzyme